MKKLKYIFIFLFVFSSCTMTLKDKQEQTYQIEKEESVMYVKIGDKSFQVVLEKNEAAKEFLNLMNPSFTLSFQDYSGFEKVGYLGRNLTRSDESYTTKPGDIVLYNGNQIVVFYGSNTWNYTKLGHIEDVTDWQNALGTGDVTITFSR